MGTQFPSRLTSPDSRQVVARLLVVRKNATQGKRGGIRALLARERREVGDDMVHEVLTVAKKKGFSDELAQSKVFLEVLDWLKWLHTDAGFGGCDKTIKRYELDKHRRPIPVLSRALREMTGAEAYLKEPFRVSSSSAAIGVLGDVARRKIQGNGKLTENERLCKKLQSVDLDELVGRYLRTFVKNAVESIMHRADPRAEVKELEDARKLADESAQRAGRRVVTRVKEAGALNDSKRIRKILVEELEKI